MSSGCDLFGTRKMVGRYVPINRSQTGVRTKRTYEPNLQNVSLISDALKKHISLKVSVKTIRTVEHNGGLDQFLIKTKAAKLTLKGRRLKRDVLKALTEQGKAPKPTKGKKRDLPLSKRAAKKAAAKGGEAKAPAKKAPAKKTVKKAA